MKELKDKGVLFTPDNAVAIREDRKGMTRRLSGLDVINAEPDRWRLNAIRGTFARFVDKNDGTVIDVKSPYTVGQRLYLKEPHYRYGKWVKSKGGYKGDACKQFVKGSGKCKVKVPTRYNDYCEEHDCPRNRRRGMTKTGKQAWRFKATYGVIMRFTLPIGYPHIKNTYRKEGWYLRPPLFMPKKFARTWLLVTEVKAPERVQDISEEDIKAEGIEFDGIWWRSVRHEIKGTLKCWPTAIMAWEKLWDSIYGDDKAKSWAANPWTWPISFKKIERPA